jgi:hypothetical protein
MIILLPLQRFARSNREKNRWLFHQFQRRDASPFSGDPMSQRMLSKNIVTILGKHSS